jgi:peptidoglycan/LPS O-acetylase OafA/YrhL
LIAAAPTLLERIRLGPAGLAPLGFQLTLTQAFVPLSDPISHRVIALGFDAPAWSLSCEAFFYALFPVCLVALYKVRGPRLLIALACLFSLWPLLLAASFHGAGATYWFLYLFPPARLADFLVGMCLGLVLLAIDRRTLSRIRSWSMLEALALGALGATVAVAGHVPIAYRFDAYYLPAMAAVIFVFALERGRLSRLLGHSTMMFFGEISFAFYMLHTLVMRAAGYPPGSAGALAHAGPLALIFVGTLALSALVHLGYELPAQRLLKRWVRR